MELNVFYARGRQEKCTTLGLGKKKHFCSQDMSNLKKRKQLESNCDHATLQLLTASSTAIGKVGLWSKMTRGEKVKTNLEYDELKHATRRIYNKG